MVRPGSGYGYGVGSEWQAGVKRNEEEARQKLEQQKQDNIERERANSGDPLFRRTGNRRGSAVSARSNAYHDGIHELETMRYTRPPEAPPTPPASVFEAPASGTILDLQRQITTQGAAIQELDCKLQSEQVKIRGLRTENHDLRAAKRHAIIAGDNEEVTRLNAKVEGLSRMLEESMEREKELERQMDEGKSRERETKRQLDRAQARVSELEHTESTRETVRGAASVEERGRTQDTEGFIAELDEQQRSDMDRLLRNMHQRRMIPQENPRSLIHSVASGRSKKHAKQMDKHGFVSVSKGSGKQVIVEF